VALRLGRLNSPWRIEHDVPLPHACRDLAGFEENMGMKRWPMVGQEVVKNCYPLE
jgi:hypothetical protein